MEGTSKGKGNDMELGARGERRILEEGKRGWSYIKGLVFQWRAVLCCHARKLVQPVVNSKRLVPIGASLYDLEASVHVDVSLDCESRGCEM